MTPAEELREAAKSMRERAQAATEGPWAWEPTGDKDNSWAVGLVQDEDENSLTGRLEPGEGVVIDGVCESIDGRLADAEHVASWSPPPVLAVADLLETVSMCRCEEGDDHWAMMAAAIKAARAYLGSEREAAS